MRRAWLPVLPTESVDVVLSGCGYGLHVSDVKLRDEQ